PRPGGAALRADRSPRALRPRLLRRRDPHLGARALPLRDSVCRAHLRYAVRPRGHRRGVSLLGASSSAAGRPLGVARGRAVAGRPAGRGAHPGATGLLEHPRRQPRHRSVLLLPELPGWLRRGRPRASLADRQLPLSDRARLRIAAAALGLSVVIVVAVWAIRPLLPSLVMKPGRLTPFAILAGALSAGLAGVWALAAGRKRASGRDGDVLAAFLPLAAFIWLLGLTGFLLWPFRYGLPWYIAGLARPVGLGVILVGLMREQIWLYREIISKN